MKIELMFQSYHENLTEFRRDTIKSEWDTLIFVVDGAYALCIGDSQRETVLGKNQIAFIPARTEFKRRIVSPPTYYNFCFYEQGTHPFYKAASPGVLRLPQVQVESIFESIHLASMFPENRELIVHIIEHTFVENYLFFSRDKGGIKPFSDEIEGAIRYMRNNIDKKISMDELARHVFLSHNGLLWKFKQELNTTPSNYLYHLRMRTAQRLLLEYSYRVAEVSEMCGYQNPYYFSNEFRRYFGVSPREFRKNT